MLNKYVEQIMRLYNYIDGIIVVNDNGIIEYYTNFRPDINNLTEIDVFGKHLFDVYPNLTEESSSIMRVLKTGVPVFNEFQTLTSYKGQVINAINNTFPIRESGKLIGAVDVSRYVDDCYQRKDITLSIRNNNPKTSLYTIDDIITASPVMDKLKTTIAKVSKTNSSVMICGETGTGKELVAQSIHTSGNRKSKKFVSQNCAAIPSTLLESILFGTVKGSYTGAENRQGLFEVANGGTLFLDEINSMELGMQAKILKAIEEKSIMRVGSVTPIKTDVRIISAINVDPVTLLQENQIRRDLFYRLNVVQIHVPPLRQRDGDIRHLVNYFIRYFNMEMGRNILDVSNDVERLFEKYSWPGNVRELRNIIEGAFNLTSSGIIQVWDLPEYIRNPLNNTSAYPEFEDSNLSLNDRVQAYEKNLIVEILGRSHNLSEAAEMLKISKQTLNYKLNKYNIQR